MTFLAPCIKHLAIVNIFDLLLYAQNSSKRASVIPFNPHRYLNHPFNSWEAEAQQDSLPKTTLFVKDSSELQPRT